MLQNEGPHKLLSSPDTIESRDGSVAIATATSRLAGVLFPGRETFFLLHPVQTVSGAHPASYPMGTTNSVLRVKAAAA
jgi:hypothetical protein